MVDNSPNDNKQSDRPSPWDEVLADINEHVTSDEEATELAGVYSRLQEELLDIEPPGGWSASKSRVENAVHSGRRKPVRLGRMAAVAVASLTLITIASVYYAWNARITVRGLSDQLAVANKTSTSILSQDEAKQSLAVFEEVAPFYDGQATWLATFGANVRVGLDSSRAASASYSREAVVIRVKLANGQSSPELTTDVVTHWGVTSVFRNTVSDGETVEYEITPLTRGPEEAVIHIRVAALAESSLSDDAQSCIDTTIRLMRGAAKDLGLIDLAGKKKTVTVSGQWQHVMAEAGEEV